MRFFASFLGSKHTRCVAAARLLCTIALLSLAACGQGKKDDYGTDIIHNPNSAQGYDTSEKLPKITFEQDMHDFGRLKAGENISYSFKFTNTGNADLVITACDASCGCTVPDYPREAIRPGQSNYVTVSFRSAGMAGMQYKEVTVSTNGQPSRTKLKIQAQVV